MHVKYQKSTMEDKVEGRYFQVAIKEFSIDNLTSREKLFPD